jgi:hypothetical protein
MVVCTDAPIGSGEFVIKVECSSYYSFWVIRKTFSSLTTPIMRKRRRNKTIKSDRN